eukprot:m.148095 g.148095  ORF g.148095 m.148095 type:complete len:67 (+) comp14202_c0_seq4:1681-1881(+)
MGRRLNTSRMKRVSSQLMCLVPKVLSLLKEARASELDPTPLLACGSKAPPLNDWFGSSDQPNVIQY